VAHEQELSRLRNYYDQHKDLLDKVDRWKKLWAQFLEFEVCCEMVDCSRCFYVHIIKATFLA